MSLSPSRLFQSGGVLEATIWPSVMRMFHQGSRVSGWLAEPATNEAAPCPFSSQPAVLLVGRVRNWNMPRFSGSCHPTTTLPYWRSPGSNVL
jgi:hypothetical protein